MNVATMCPVVLKKSAPVTWMPCPAVPLEGLSDEMTGGPLGAATATVVEVVVELDVDPLPFPAPPFPVLVDEGWEAGAAAWVGPATVDDVGAVPPLRETARAMAPITTRTATVATDPTSPAGQHRDLFCEITVEKNGAKMTATTANGGVLRIDRPVAPVAPASTPAVAAAAASPSPTAAPKEVAVK